MCSDHLTVGMVLEKRAGWKQKKQIQWQMQLARSMVVLKVHWLVILVDPSESNCCPNDFARCNVL